MFWWPAFVYCLGAHMPSGGCQKCMNKGADLWDHPPSSDVQDHPVAASTICCREQVYASVHKSCFCPFWFNGNHLLISMLVGAGGHDVGWVAEDQCHVNKSHHASCQVLTSIPSINGQNKGQKLICSSVYPCWWSRIQASVYLSGSMFISPPQPLLQHLHLWRRQCPWFQHSLPPHAEAVQRQLIAPFTGVVHRTEQKFWQNSTPLSL